MAKEFSKYVYAIDLDTARVVSTTGGLSDMKRKIVAKTKFGKPFPESVVFYQASIKSPLLQLDTDELIGYHMIQNALVAGVACGVDAKTVIGRLAEAGFVKAVEMEKVKMFGS